MGERRTIDELNAMWLDPVRLEKVSKAREAFTVWRETVAALARKHLGELANPNPDREER